MAVAAAGRFSDLVTASGLRQRKLKRGAAGVACFSQNGLGLAEELLQAAQSSVGRTLNIVARLLKAGVSGEDVEHSSKAVEGSRNTGGCRKNVAHQ